MNENSMSVTAKRSWLRAPAISVLLFSLLLSVTAVSQGPGGAVDRTNQDNGHDLLGLGGLFGIIEKREVDKRKSGYTTAEKDAIVIEHNILRKLVNASNMLDLIWSDELEKKAQDFAIDCSYSHDWAVELGQNMYASADTYNGTYAVLAWGRERSNYDYNTGHCQDNKECGNYTQLVWAKSHEVGCGVKYCDPLDPIGSAEFFIVCFYSPAGNIDGEKPYILVDPKPKTHPPQL